MNSSPTTNGPAAEAAGSNPVGYELMFIAGLSIVAAMIAWQAFELPMFATDGTVGPGFFPVPLSLMFLAGLLFHGAQLGRLWRRAHVQTVESLFVRSQYIAIVLMVLAAIIGSIAGLTIAVIGLLFGGLMSIERLCVRESLVFSAGFLSLFYLVFDRWLGQNIGLNGIF